MEELALVLDDILRKGIAWSFITITSNILWALSVCSRNTWHI